MTTKLRKTGINLIGEMPWGSHFCRFHETKQDLFDTVLPYFKAGLENNEFCLWIIAESLTEEDVKRTLQQAIPNFAHYLSEQSIEILPYDEWYLKGGRFDLHRVIDGWRGKLDQALARGYAGMRVAACTAWLQKKDWKDFRTYELALNEALARQRMIVLCAYSLAASGVFPAGLLDVGRTVGRCLQSGSGGRALGGRKREHFCSPAVAAGKSTLSCGRGPAAGQRGAAAGSPDDRSPGEGGARVDRRA